MEEEYKSLLTISKTVSVFYETVYAPVLQGLPWLDTGNNLQTVTEKILPNLAYVGYELSSYKDKKEDEKITASLRARHQLLESMYQKMQDELRPIMKTAGIQGDKWKQLAEMVPEWNKLSKSNVLPLGIHNEIKHSISPSANMQRLLVEKSYTSTSTSTSSTSGEAGLARLMADKIKSLIAEGESDSSITILFGTQGHWLEQSFVNSFRKY
ncbi:MAG: hypothetical protein MJE68_01270 [Proteobacteria bacterium]|nr:hypothetical protein [Pseudomonadota bacterium]